MTCYLNGPRSYKVNSISSSKSNETISLQGNYEFTFKYETNVIEEEPLSSNQIYNQTINGFNKTTFSVNLERNFNNPPLIYLNNNESNIVSCEKKTDDSKVLICTPTEENMPKSEKNQTYTVWYKEGNGPLVESKITVTKLGIKIYRVKKITLENNTTCFTSNQHYIYLTVERPEYHRIFGVLSQKLEHRPGHFKYCYYSSDKLVCSFENYLGEPYEVNYTLTSLITDSPNTYFDLTDVANTVLEMHNETVGLGEQLTNQTITDDYTFLVILKNETKPVPPIFIENYENKIDCVRTYLTKLVCYPDPSIISDNKVYNIYYKPACGNLTSTGIQIIKISKETITVTQASHDPDKITNCTVVGKKKVYITTDKKISGSISGKIKDVNNTETSFDSCTTYNDTQIVCTVPDTLSQGYYQLSNISTNDSAYKLSISNDAHTNLLYKPTLIGIVTDEQKNQTLDQNNKKIVVPINSDKAPILYLDKEGKKDITSYFDCEIVDSNYECIEKDNGLDEGNYTLYYYCECYTIISTDIKITKISLEENESSYIEMYKILFILIIGIII